MNWGSNDGQLYCKRHSTMMLFAWETYLSTSKGPPLNRAPVWEDHGFLGDGRNLVGLAWSQRKALINHSRSHWSPGFCWSSLVLLKKSTKSLLLMSQSLLVKTSCFPGCGSFFGAEKSRVVMVRLKSKTRQFFWSIATPCWGHGLPYRIFDSQKSQCLMVKS